MTKEITFYKKKDRWFAYLPEFIAIGGTEAECEMVHGADTFLDMLSGSFNYVTLKISDTQKMGSKLTQIDSDRFGSTYICLNYNDRAYNHFLWLCPVTLSVFDKYPSEIYFEVLEKGEADLSEFEYAPVSIWKKLWHITKLVPRILTRTLKRTFRYEKKTKIKVVRK